MEPYEFILSLICGVIFGILVGYTVTENVYRQEAIEIGCAQYNQTTGDWEWKRDLEKLQ